MAFNKFQYEKLRAKRHANRIKQKQEIYEIKHSNDPERKKPAYNKLLVAFIFMDCFAIQVFIMVMMWIMKDMSQIGGLIGLIGTLFIQGISLISYNDKAKAENTSGGIVYQNMIQNFMNNTVNKMSDDSSDSEDAVG